MHHMVPLFLGFQVTLILFSTVALLIYITTHNVRGILFPHMVANKDWRRFSHWTGEDKKRKKYFIIIKISSLLNLTHVIVIQLWTTSGIVLGYFFLFGTITDWVSCLLGGNSTTWATPLVLDYINSLIN
jgi:hypothetical protein